MAGAVQGAYAGPLSRNAPSCGRGTVWVFNIDGEKQTLESAAGAARCLHRPTMLTERTLARQGTVVFDIDGEKWTLDLRPGQRKVTQGAPEGKPDLTLTISDDNFVKLVSGKMGPQQARSKVDTALPWR